MAKKVKIAPNRRNVLRPAAHASLLLEWDVDLVNLLPADLSVSLKEADATRGKFRVAEAQETADIRRLEFRIRDLDAPSCLQAGTSDSELVSLWEGHRIGDEEDLVRKAAGLEVFVDLDESPDEDPDLGDTEERELSEEHFGTLQAPDLRDPFA